MRVRSLGVLLLRLCGLYFVVGAVTSAAQLALAFMPGLDDATNRFTFASNTVGLVIQALVGGALLGWAESIVKLLRVEESESEHPKQYSLADLQSVAFGAVGAYLAITGFRHVATLVWAIARHPSWDDTGTLAFVFERRQEQLVGATVQLFAATILLVRRSAWAALWYRMRPMAETPEEPPTS